jgi:hypothetical protein
MIDDPYLLSLVNSLGESDSVDPVGDTVKALDAFDALADPQLASLLCSKEGIAKIKDRVVVEDTFLRSIFISRLGCLVVRSWTVIHADSFDIEGMVAGSISILKCLSMKLFQWSHITSVRIVCIRCVSSLHNTTCFLSV